MTGRPRTPSEIRAIKAKGPQERRNRVPAKQPAPLGHRVGPYVLYRRESCTMDGRPVTLYFFAHHKARPKSGAPAPLPPDRVVVRNPRNGLPVLKKVNP